LGALTWEHTAHESLLAFRAERTTRSPGSVRALVIAHYAFVAIAIALGIVGIVLSRRRERVAIALGAIGSLASVAWCVAV